MIYKKPKPIFVDLLMVMGQGKGPHGEEWEYFYLSHISH